MNVKHPDGKRTIVMVGESALIAEIEECKSCSDNDFLFITIGGLGLNSCTLVDSDEWDAFVALIKETDEVVQGLKKENTK